MSSRSVSTSRTTGREILIHDELNPGRRGIFDHWDAQKKEFTHRGTGFLAKAAADEVME